MRIVWNVLFALSSFLPSTNSNGVMCIRKVTHFISCVNLPLISSIRVVLLGRDWFTLEFSQARTYPACLSSARLVTCNQFVCLDGKSSGARPERAAVWMDARSSFLARRLKKSDAHTRKLRPREPGPEETDFDLVPPQPGREAAFACAQPDPSGCTGIQTPKFCMPWARLGLIRATKHALTFLFSSQKNYTVSITSNISDTYIKY